MTKASTNVFHQRYQKLLCKITGYYANNILYRFVYAESGIRLMPASLDAFAPYLLIIAKPYYQEQLKNYPIENKKELKKLLALEFSQTQFIYNIIPSNTSLGDKHNDAQSRVNIWQLDKNDLKAKIPSVKVILPESFLLALTLDNNQILQQDCLSPSDDLSNKKQNQPQSQTKKLFVAAANKATVSALNSPLINNFERFCHSLGLSYDVKENSVAESSVYQESTAEQLSERLINGLSKCPLSLSTNFLVQETKKKDTPIVKAIALPIVAVFTIYLGITSAWLYWQQQSLMSEVAAQKTDVNQALQIQEQFIAYQQQFALLDDFSNQQQARSLFWIIWSELIEDAQISTIRYINNRYVLIGKTNKVAKVKDEDKDNVVADPTEKPASIIFKATAYLEKLIQQPGVIDAKFDSSVRISKTHESFTISFLIDASVLNSHLLADNNKGSK
ncbi:MAG: hypothetical protein HRT52_16750 [Colwellia sp.]|nr:hypothetical protein [Colwellia sp.]